MSSLFSPNLLVVFLLEITNFPKHLIYTVPSTILGSYPRFSGQESPKSSLLLSETNAYTFPKIQLHDLTSFHIFCQSCSLACMRALFYLNSNATMTSVIYTIGTFEAFSFSSIGTLKQEQILKNSSFTHNKVMNI